MNTTRCFVGIELADDVRRALVASCSAIRDGDPTWRDEKWVAPANLHVTLKFLGDVADDRLSRLVDALGSALAELPEASIVATGLRAVPNSRRAGMLWATFSDPEGDVERMAKAVSAVAAQIGVAEESRPFRAHATLVRARRPRRIDVPVLETVSGALAMSTDAMSVPSATLFASTLTRSGPEYVILAALPLGGG